MNRFTKFLKLRKSLLTHIQVCRWTIIPGYPKSRSLPQGFAYQSTGSVVINGKSAVSRLQPAAGSPTPQWGPFVVPAGGFNGATLVITFTAKISGASLGPHANVVSGNSSNAQMIGGSDQSPVIVTSG